MPVASLENRRVISITGEDREAFLQGLVTCDMTALESGKARYGALLTPQGKILFDFLILATNAELLIDCSASQHDALLQRLTMYKLRRKVDLNSRDDLGVAALWQQDAPETEADVICYRDPRLEAAGFRLLGPRDKIKAMGNSSVADYEAHRIHLGLADTDADIGTGSTFAHEANLDQLGGISFTKGCYVGQEVVSRMQHRGTARNRIVKVSADAQNLPSNEDVLAGERRIGTVLSTAGDHGLAMVRLDKAGQAEADGVTLTAAGIPVAIEVPEWANFKIAAPETT